LTISIPVLTLLFFQTIVHGENLKVDKLVLFKSYVDKSIIEELGGTILEEYKNIPAVQIKIPEENVNLLSQNNKIKSIENEQKVKIEEQTENWGVNAIEAPKAWQSHYTGKGVKIAVIDTGIYSHEDLSIAGGKSFVSYTSSYTDDNGHGTHVAGIIAAKNNNVGIVGVAPDAQLYAVKVLRNDGSGNMSDIISGIDWAITNKMNMINLSLGSTESSNILEETINKASKAGILVIAAAGNNGNSNGTGDTVNYPARYDSVIAVGATDIWKQRASFSSTGNEVDFVAPGVNILSTVLDNQYVSHSGTSMAAPFVTGDLALLKEMYPTMSNQGLVDQLKKKALDLGAPGHDPLYGYGLIQSPFGPERISGSDRFQVAVKVSQEGWTSSNTVLISNYMAFADALSAAPLAYKNDAPILLTEPNSLNSLTKQEMVRLGAKHAIIIGGNGSVSNTVAAEIQSMGINVKRIDGINRFEVSRNIANEMGSFQTAIIANGLNFPDALSIAPYAALNGYPILLTEPHKLPAETSDVLNVKAVKNTIVVGGKASVDNAVFSELPSAIRIGGKDRYEVAKNIFESYYPDSSKLFIATGSTFADALTGSVLMAKDKTTLLLTEKDDLPDSTSLALSERSVPVQNFVILGGVGSVGNNVLSLLSK
ncbi:MAG TPA: S8 family serine peptidase, partial [Bacillales bacterium]|nr:S8 family serine peptidase [Bacillales bacterium]